MASKPKIQHVCQSCGGKTPKWVGRCPTCGAWGTVVEEAAARPPDRSRRAAFGALAASKPMRLDEIDGRSVQRESTGIGELDRVLGGGLVPGSLILVGGDPGIGKSTLLLQASDALARAGRRVLYVTGEESPEQTRIRYDRLAPDAATPADLWLLAETSVERVEQHVSTLDPRVLIVDSIQTLYTEQVSSAPGSVSQVRESTGRLMMLAKGRGVATFLVGHVTKDGAIAGPRVLEHMVDTVLYFEGDAGSPFRILRAVKNRFGSTNEIGAFEMRSEGLCEVENPSAKLLAERAAGSAGSVVAAGFEGTRPLLVEVQALICPTSSGSPRRTAVGVDLGRVALLLAVLEKKAGLCIGAADVFVNVAGGMRLHEPAADLAVLAALASSHLERALDPDTVVFGEVGLGGEVRAVTGAEQRVREARLLGFRRVVLPRGNAGLQVEGVSLTGVAHVQDLMDVVLP